MCEACELLKDSAEEDGHPLKIAFDNAMGEGNHSENYFTLPPSVMDRGIYTRDWNYE